MSDPQATNQPGNNPGDKSEEAKKREKKEQEKKEKREAIRTRNAELYIKDPDGNEIIRWEKFLYGAVLVLFTVLPAVLIICFWPDRLPRPDEKLAPLYICDPFDIRLACLPDSCCPECVYGDSTTSVAAAGSTTTNTEVAATDSPATTTSSSTNTSPTTTSPNTTASSATTETSAASTDTSLPNEKTQRRKIYSRDDLIHINTLLLILVALGGFLGNMIHVATSFTTFVGSGKFKRSWMLWYCIKPFTASALAIGIYFVFRGGFLNMNDGGASINLYGLMTISLFAGLFTDKATEKLKEVFEVLFRSREERPDPLVSKFKILNVSPLIIEKDKVNKMTITGEKLDAEKLKVSIADIAIDDIKTSASTIIFDYTIPDDLKNSKTLTISVKDDKGTEHFKIDLTVKEPDAQAPGAPNPEGEKPGGPPEGTNGEKPGTEEKDKTKTGTETDSADTEPDPSASADDDDDTDETGETDNSIIKG